MSFTRCHGALGAKIAATVILLLVCATPTVAFAIQSLTVEFIDVGAGDSIYIETPSGADILIDGGVVAQGPSVVAQLQALEPGMTLEYVINTHPDADHAGGLQEVFRRMVVKKFYYPKDAPYTTTTAKILLSLVKAEPNCIVYDAKPGMLIKSGGARFLFVHSATNYDTTNKDSVMTYLYYGTLQVLFTGDAERGAEAAARRYNVDILQVPHHGSRYSSSASFIRRFDPERIIISTDGTSYGHPHLETLRRYHDYSSSILCYRTDKLGNIKFASNGTRWWFRTSDVGKRVGSYLY